MMKAEKQFLAAYDQFAAAILRHIFFRVNDRFLAQDLTQETFFKAWRSLARKEEGVKNFKSFLYKIANNLIIDHYRSKPRSPDSLDEVDEIKIIIGPTQEIETEKLINNQIIHKHLDDMGEEYKQILLLRYVDDLSIKEICAITGKTPNHISVSIHRGIKMLKEKINVWKV